MVHEKLKVRNTKVARNCYRTIGAVLTSLSVETLFGWHSFGPGTLGEVIRILSRCTDFHLGYEG